MDMSSYQYSSRREVIKARITRLSVAGIIDRAAERYGDKVFVHTDDPLCYNILEGDSVTFSQCRRSVNILANAMRDRLGIRKGDRMAIVLTNRGEFGIFCGAASRLGAVFVPFNYMHKADELAYGMNDCGARVLVTEKELFDDNIGDRSKLPGIEHWILTGPKEGVPPGFISIDDLTGGCSERWEGADIDPNELAGIFYTSGTTSWPKGAMLTSRNLIVPVSRSVRMLRVNRKDVSVVVLPLSHIFGFVTQFLAGTISGATGYLMRYFDPVKALENMERYGATIFAGVPAMYNMMLNEHPEKYDLSSVRLWISGADAMPVDYIKRFESISGRFVEGYGMVETSSLISVNLPFIRKPGSMGIPVPGVKVRIMDENDNFLPRGEIGEIAVKGACVMKGYWNNEEANRRAFVDGWMRTGDIGKRDRLGYIYFVDREKDVIKCGGYSIFSREVEEKILSHPKVFTCALVGAPHPEKGEIPVAFIQLNEGQQATSEELLDWCKKNIAAYKAPRRVEIVPSLPMTMTLKVLKRELRELLSCETD